MMIDATNIQELSDEAINIGAIAGLPEFIAEQTRRELAKS